MKKKVKLSKNKLFKKSINFPPHILFILILVGIFAITIEIFFLKPIVYSEGDFVPSDIMQEFKSEKASQLIKPNTQQLISHGSRTIPKIALTFDADMTYGMEDLLHSGKVKSYYDEHLINVLKTNNTKATFFLTGLWIETYPKIAQNLAQNPLFELANHSYDHKAFDGYCYGLRPIDNGGEKMEVEKTQDLLKNLGVSNKYFRFPGGCYSQKDLDILSSLGMTGVQWDTAGVDGFNDNKESIENNILDHVQNGSIIVMHMNGYPNEPVTAGATADLIFKLRQRGFEFVTLSELLSH
ncbi:MAG TPA: polysaccharide deacetylase family protein [Patescibacteria group bacterium]